MTAPAQSRVGSPANAETAAVRKRRPGARRRRSGWLLLAVGVLWLLGNGMGWFGSAPDGQPDPGGESGPGGKTGAARDADQAGGTGQRVETPPAAARGTLDPADVAKAALVSTPAEGSPPAALSTASVPAATRGMAKDRFDSLVSLLELHIEERELGQASGVIERLRAQSLHAEQRAALARIVARLQPLRDAAERRVLAEVRGGDVLSADRQAKQLVVGNRWLAPILTAAVAARGVRIAPTDGAAAAGEDWQRPLAEGIDTGPAVAPLARNRQVLVRWREELRPGVVANSRLDEVTVRLRSGEGQSYPTVRAIACEPIESTAKEAIEMGFAAVRANAPRLARLWLLRAALLQGELSDRGRQLLRLLR